MNTLSKSQRIISSENLRNWMMNQTKVTVSISLLSSISFKMSYISRTSTSNLSKKKLTIHSIIPWFWISHAAFFMISEANSTMKNLKMKNFTETHKQVWKYQKITFRVSMNKKTAELIEIRLLTIWIPISTGRIGLLSTMIMQTTHSQKTNRTSWITFTDKARKWRNCQRIFKMINYRKT
jgi:hypothetical protein